MLSANEGILRDQPTEEIQSLIEIAPKSEVEDNPLLEKFSARASERNIKPVKGGDWLDVDGVKHVWANVEKGGVHESTDYGNFDRRLEQVGTYYSNNSTLAYVDGQGKMHVGHSTHENWKALQEAGYRQGSIWVPFSNGEIPTDPDIQKQYLELRERGREVNKKRAKEGHLRLYSEKAEQQGLKPVEEGLWMMVDGIEYKGFGNDTGQIEVNTDGYNMPIHRVEQVGTYDSNNGRLAYVDGEGQMWVGASTQQNLDALRNAGYGRGGIWVPFSNGEMPTDRETYEKLRDILTGKTAEQLEVERNARVDEIFELRRKLFGDVAVLPDREKLFAKVADRAERQYVNIEKLTGERFSPHKEKDAAGFERVVYTHDGRTFAFKGREELPTYDTLTTSKSRILGEKPNWIDDEDWKHYQRQVEATQQQTVESEHLVVNKSLLGVVELAIELGSKDESLSQIRENVSNGVYTKRELDLLDALVATSYDGWGYVGSNPNPNAEATVVLALLGDEEAQAAIAESVETMRRADQSKRVYPEGESSDTEPLNPNELVVVHATRYKPETDEEGNLLVKTTFDATDGKVIRNSVHTALNHKVAGHMYGSWGDAGYVLISPLNSMIESNGLPRTLNTVDTYWTANPGESVVFSEATLVAPGGSDVEGLFAQEGNLVKFKSDGIDTEELLALQEHHQTQGNSSNFATNVERSVFDAFERWGSGSEMQETWDYDTAIKAINMHLYGEEIPPWGNEPALLRELTTSEVGETQTLQQKLSKLLVESDATKAIKPGVQERDEAVRQMAEAMANKVKTLMFTQINEITVSEAILNRGYDIKPGGMWAWGDSWGVTARTHALGIELGIQVAAHTNTVDHELTERFSRTIGAAYGEEEDDKKFHWEKYNPTFDEFIPKLDSKSRRVLYASGLLTSRA